MRQWIEGMNVGILVTRNWNHLSRDCIMFGKTIVTFQIVRKLYDDRRQVVKLPSRKPTSCTKVPNYPTAWPRIAISIRASMVTAGNMLARLFSEAWRPDGDKDCPSITNAHSIPTKGCTEDWTLYLQMSKPGKKWRLKLAVRAKLVQTCYSFARRSIASESSDEKMFLHSLSTCRTWNSMCNHRRLDFAYAGIEPGAPSTR